MTPGDPCSHVKNYTLSLLVQLVLNLRVYSIWNPNNLCLLMIVVIVDDENTTLTLLDLGFAAGKIQDTANGAY